MGEMTVFHREDGTSAVLVRDHVIYVDEPYAKGGMDTGPTATELFVASLAACAADYARRYLAQRGLPAYGLEVTAGFTMTPMTPARVSSVELRLRPPLRLSDDEAGGLLAAVEHCTVRDSILDPPRIGMHLEVPAVAA